MFFLGRLVCIEEENDIPLIMREHDDYKGYGSSIFKGVIHTRKGDTNKPKTSTADLYDTEILWKRRFGLLCNPSQRAKFYIRELENWERINEEEDKFGLRRFFL